MTDDNLDLPMVVERFEQSTTALDEVREKLKAIIVAEEGAGAAATAISDAAARLSGLTASVEATLPSLTGATEATVSALSLADGFFERVEELRTSTAASIDAVAVAIDSIASDVGDLVTVVGTLATDVRAVAADVRVLSARVEQVAARIPEAQAVEERWQERWAQLPERARKKVEGG